MSQKYDINDKYRRLKVIKYLPEILKTIKPQKQGKDKYLFEFTDKNNNLYWIIIIQKKNLELLSIYPK